MRTGAPFAAPWIRWTLLVLALTACGAGERADLSGFNPGLPFGTDAGDDGAGPPADVTADAPPPDVPSDPGGEAVGPDVPPVACTADTACDDGLPCTADYCGDDGLCHHGIRAGRCLIEGVCLEAGAAQWGNACKTCQPGVSPIAWSAVSCDDGDPCTVDACDPAGGCRYEPGSCGCLSDADCAPLDDDDLCNGRLVCRPVRAPGRPDAASACVPDPSTVVTCDTSDDTPCLRTTCVPATGACVKGAVNGPCDDGDGCTLSDTCAAGVCAGTPCAALGQVCRQGACVAPACGDGWLDAGEACDDEDDDDGDGCSKHCTVEEGWSCQGQPSTCVQGQVLTYTFDGDDGSFSGTDGWESQYCSDAWTTADNGGVFPNTDDGCGIEEDQCTAAYSCGYDWGYWVQGGYCQASDPFDNHLTWGDKEWTDYTFQVRFRNDDDDTVGVVFRYWNSGQFYLLYLSRDQAPKEWVGCNQTFVGARLLRIREQQSKLLAKVDVTYQVGQVHALRVRVEGPHLTAHFDADADGDLADEAPLFDLVDPQPLLQGKVGLYAYENGATGDSFDPCSNGGCWFDDVAVSLHAP